MANNRRLLELKDRLDSALRNNRLEEACSLCGALERLEPREPRWPHRRGDALRRLGRNQAAAEAYAGAVDRYAAQGFVARASAMAKVVMKLDPQRGDILGRVDQDEARRLHRSVRRPLTAQSTTHRPVAVVGDDGVHASRAPTLRPLEEKPSFASQEGGLRIDMSALEVASQPPPRRTLQPAAPTSTQPPRSSRPSLPSLAPVARPSLPEPEDAFDDLLPEPMFESRQSQPGPARDAWGDARSANPFEDEAPTAEQLALLPGVSLFAEVPQDALMMMLHEAERREHIDGRCVLRRDDPADALWVIVQGRVRLEGETPDQRPVVLAEGDVFGEACLLAGARNRRDVVVVGRLEALRVPKLTLDRVVQQHACVGETLFELLTRRLLGDLLRTSPLFRSLSADQRSDVARLFEVRRAAAGTDLLQSGKKADGLYVLLAGQCWVRDDPDALAIELTPGSVFGQRSLLTSAAEPSTVTAEGEVLVLRLPAVCFGRLTSQYPPVLAPLAQLALDPLSAS